MAAKYRGAGTVEFLVQDDKFYFMEMNTRLQVEHPVTEFVMGVDLVKAQILTAMGSAVPWIALGEPRGHAIECRLYAEDPYLGGIPSTGRLGLRCTFPMGRSAVLTPDLKPVTRSREFYDAMIGKLIVWDESRIRAIQKMRRVLEDTIIFGVQTNIPLLKSILQHPDFVEGTMTTRCSSIKLLSETAAEKPTVTYTAFVHEL